MKLLITGASGYIGSHLVQLAISHNHEIVVASRRLIPTALSCIFYDLNKTSSVNLSEGFDALFHLAADTSDYCGDGSKEFFSAKHLLSESTKIGAKFIFVSSQTARDNAPTDYGRTKWRIEQEVLKAGGIVVRFGQVYGGTEQGLFGSLVRLVRLLPLLPAFLPSPFIQPIHVDDCAMGLLNLLELDVASSKIYFLGAPEPIPFTKFLHLIARHRLRCRKFFVPVPIILIKIFLKFIGTKYTTRLGLNRLNSLFDLPAMVTGSSLDAIKLKLRPINSGMHCSGTNRRRMLLMEGRAMLFYILRDNPQFILVRRYVRMVEDVSNRIPLGLPSVLIIWPRFLSLFESVEIFFHKFCGEFKWRINTATLIAEASTQGAPIFIGTNYSGHPLGVSLQILLVFIKDIFWKLLSLIIFTLFYKFFKCENYYDS